MPVPRSGCVLDIYSPHGKMLCAGGSINFMYNPANTVPA